MYDEKTGKHLEACEHCGELVDIDDLRETVDGGYVCDNCYFEDYTYCDICHRAVQLTELVNANGYDACQNCFDEYYTRCYNCGDVIEIDNAYDINGESYCAEYYDGMTEAIHQYSYKPYPVFYGDGTKLYYGLELEIDNGDDDRACASDIADIVSDSAYMKRDGSLDNGFEIVTHPMTLDYHIKTFNWQAVCNTAVGHRFRSHNTTTCGLHIHASRAGFGDTQDEQDLNIAKVMILFDKYWDNVVRFSRRSYHALDEWAKKLDVEYREGDSEQEAIIKAKAKAWDRYRAINLTNEHTVEFRVFKGTLKYNTIIATIQFIDTLISICKKTKLSDFHRITWNKIFNDTEHKELKAYMAERNIKGVM